MGWQDAIFLQPPRIFLQFFIVVFCCFIFVAKERSPKILVETNLGLEACKKIQSSLAYNLYI